MNGSDWCGRHKKRTNFLRNCWPSKRLSNLYSAEDDWARLNKAFEIKTTHTYAEFLPILEWHISIIWNVHIVYEKNTEVNDKRVCKRKLNNSNYLVLCHQILPSSSLLSSRSLMYMKFSVWLAKSLFFSLFPAFFLTPLTSIPYNVPWEICLQKVLQFHELLHIFVSWIHYFKRNKIPMLTIQSWLFCWQQCHLVQVLLDVLNSNGAQHSVPLEYRHSSNLGSDIVADSQIVKPFLVLPLLRLAFFLLNYCVHLAVLSLKMK